ncbi:hypothetical protein PanWU01x14_060560 [Parasponia andersonii]|uniref:Uncharacterized protein n=1 Tax=Parasponia andersonii TaxID=3476 RepID=A0A2P5DIZ2_PARAD|nr:hypothetical protein PanWU01x14_060560 [Parasponia andersonii]
MLAPGEISIPVSKMFRCFSGRKSSKGQSQENKEIGKGLKFGENRNPNEETINNSSEVGPSTGIAPHENAITSYELIGYVNGDFDRSRKEISTTTKKPATCNIL